MQQLSHSTIQLKGPHLPKPQYISPLCGDLTRGIFPELSFNTGHLQQGCWFVQYGTSKLELCWV